MCCSFEFLSGPEPTAERFCEVLTTYEAAIGDGWACWAFSNHDVVRHDTRWSFSEASNRLFARLLLSLLGSICLYLGEELGLTEAEVSFEDLQDPYGIRFWPKFKGRDGCRTPMTWVSYNQNGGFSDGKPWLPVAREHMRYAVANQANDPNSTLEFYRTMVAFWGRHPVLAKGSFTLVQGENGVVVFLREFDGTHMFCAFNPTDTAQSITLPQGDWQALDDAPFAASQSTGRIRLPPFQACFGIKDTAT
jgi:alpha-glucosidase